MWTLVYYCLAIAPPVGGTYERRVALPYLGAQRIRVHIHSPTTGVLAMTGALALADERFTYRPTSDDSSSFSIQLGPRTRSLLASTRTELQSARYDAARDATVVVLKPPIVPAVCVTLRRVSK